MPQDNKRTNESPSGFRKWQSKLPYFVGALLLHLLAFVMLATWVIFKAPVPPPEASFQAVKIAAPPPPPAPPQAAGGEAANALEPDLTVVPPPTAPSVAAVHNTAAFNVASVNLPEPSLSSMAPAKGTGLSTEGASGSGLGAGSVFGSDNNSGNGMTGYFYDLKQTPDHQPTGMDVDKQHATLEKFFAEHWNEDDWATKFLKSPKPLYANELMVPLQYSLTGPKSFGMASICKPGFWAAVYHLKITASRSGNFRVAGYGDDYLVVAVDGDVVLDSGYYSPVTNFKRIKIYPSQWLENHPTARPDYAQTVVGTPFHMDPGESLTFDVLISDANAEAGGMGICGYFLFLLEDGKDYPTDAGGNPIFPVLQVQPDPDLKRDGKHPPFTSNREDALLGS